MLRSLSKDAYAYTKSGHREALKQFVVCSRWGMRNVPNAVYTRNLKAFTHDSGNDLSTQQMWIQQSWNNLAHLKLSDVLLEIANKWKRKWGTNLNNTTFVLLFDCSAKSEAKVFDSQNGKLELDPYISKLNGYYRFKIEPSDIQIVLVGKTFKGERTQSYR